MIRKYHLNVIAAVATVALLVSPALAQMMPGHSMMNDSSSTANAPGKSMSDMMRVVIHSQTQMAASFDSLESHFRSMMAMDNMQALKSEMTVALRST